MVRAGTLACFWFYRITLRQAEVYTCDLPGLAVDEVCGTLLPGHDGSGSNPVEGP